MSVKNVKKWQNSGELNWASGFEGPLLKVGTGSHEGILSAPGGSLFFGANVSEMGKAEKCPHPREPLSGTPTTQIGGWEMIVQCVPYTAPVFL